MTTYFFPFGVLNPTATSASFTQLATSASFTASGIFFHITASSAKSIRTPVSGAKGPTNTTGTGCTTAPKGDTGPEGFIGLPGPNLTTCPSGTTRCVNLTHPAGHIVCIQNPIGCTGNIVCPDTLPL